MGYFIFSYAIDYDKLNRSIGSKDIALLEKIQQSDKFQEYVNQDLPADIGTAEALRQIINGQAPDTSCAPSYWHALICLIDYLGKPVGSGERIVLNYETDLINQILREDFKVDLEVEEVLLNGKLDIGLPLPNDWPLSGILHLGDLFQLQLDLSHVKLSHEHIIVTTEEDEEEARVLDGIQSLKDSIDYCLQHNKVLISFCH
ncbi:hypothetical protein SAMN05444266_105479 [Chitinophaga jiangningensis]|uniref:DUF7691 domain-containing protein n=1 Tax=Chitinophaga jiangningensis TaxID=1419482 RepID=A0A1M7EKG3_9BACT|nr:hypothetical protein [Chitinophaga jiangningensis]SHL92138.1 hypothetical protein SAMN05444266_105479 [Chitinophaga jiangningensis]